MSKSITGRSDCGKSQGEETHGIFGENQFPVPGKQVRGKYIVLGKTYH